MTETKKREEETMAKHIIELDYYDDRSEIDMLINAKDAYSALWDIDQILRSHLKNEVLTPEQERLYESLRELAAEPLRYYA